MANKYEFFDDYVIGYANSNKQFIVDIDDYDLIKDYNWYINSNGYVKTNTNGKKSMHRLIMQISDEKIHVDHINHNRSDNRKCNLRLATNSQNQMNKDVGKNNTSGFKGVSWHKNKNGWISQIQINGKLKYLGIYKNIEDAIQARIDAENKYFKEFNYNPDIWDVISK